MAGPLNNAIPLYASYHEKTGALGQFSECVSSAYDFDQAIDSTCLVSMNRERKPKDGKLKKQASTEEMIASVEEVQEAV